MGRHFVSVVVTALSLAFIAAQVRAQDSVSNGDASTKTPTKVAIGIAARYMPTGWFHRSAEPYQTRTTVGAYPAVGTALFLDWYVNTYLAIGLMPELGLNVIPKVQHYAVSGMHGCSLRVSVEYPKWSSIVPYVLLAPGYAWIWRYSPVADSLSGDASGFLVSLYGGARFPLGKVNAAFAEFGYMQGFERSGNKYYAPSYLALAAGWRVSF